MPSANRLSFVVGAVATSVLAFTALAAIPDSQGVVPQKAASVWKGNTFTRVSFCEPLDSPFLSHAPDGSVFVESGRTVAPTQGPERFSPERGAFELASKSAHSAPVQAWPETFPKANDVPGDAKLRVDVGSLGQATYFNRAGVYVQGPDLPPATSIQSAFVDGSRTALLWSTRQAAPELWTLEEGDTEYRSVPLKGLVARAVGHDGSRLLVVTQDGLEVSTHFVDMRSGAVADGPRIPTPKDAAPTWAMSSAWIPGGGAILVENGNYDGPLVQPADVAAAVGLLAEVALLGLALAKKRLVLSGLLPGMAVGVLGFGVLLLGRFLWDVTHAQHLW